MSSVHPPGTFCWIELGTTDRAAAEAFYGGLFGWTAEHTPMGPGPDDIYTQFRLGGKQVGACYGFPPNERAAGARPSWLGYIATDDVDGAAARAAAAGATVTAGPMDVMGHGRMALLADAEGAAFALWQARAHPGVDVRDEVGTLCWNELATRDMDRTKRLYTAITGWTTAPMAMPHGEYTLFMRGETMAGGALTMTKEWGDMPSHWMTYFRVADTDATAARCAELGGKVCVPPFDAPPVGRIAVLEDPGGAVFSVIRMAE